MHVRACSCWIVCLSFVLVAPRAAFAGPHSTAVHGGQFPPPCPQRPPRPIPQKFAPPRLGGIVNGGGARPGASAPGPATFGAPGIPNRDEPAVPRTPGAKGDWPGALGAPYTLGSDDIDLLAWELWWHFNRDAYIRFDARASSQGSDEFSLGRGEALPELAPTRIPQSLYQDHVSSALLPMVRGGGDVIVMRDTLLAVTKGARHFGPQAFEYTLRAFLRNNETLEVTRAAVLGMGILAPSQSLLRELVPLALDTPQGRALAAGSQDTSRPLDLTLRASALHAIAIGGARASQAERSEVARALLPLVSEPSTPPDLRVTALFTLGFLPLALDAEAGSGMLDLVAFVSRFLEDESVSPPLMAAAANALGRLLGAAGDACPERYKESAIDLLVQASSLELPAVVQENAALGLALAGDCDGDAADQWAQYTLHRAIWEGGELERRFALIALAQVTSRAGRGEAPFFMLDQARNIFVHQLNEGRRSLRPWAALAIGVHGHELLRAGETLDPGVNLALRTAIAANRTGDGLGALAIAAGMRRDGECVEPLLRHLRDVRDDAERAHVALALGMIGDRSATAALVAVLDEPRASAELRAEAGLALGLLGYDGPVGTLVERLLACSDVADRIGYARALGGIGSSAAVEFLGARFADATVEPAERAAIAVALGRFGDGDSIPWNARLARCTSYRGCPQALTNPSSPGTLDLR